ncbi:MAG: YceI family protein [Chitinophagaceae bacterium]|nr:YceI family protein [Chitinophagaceae bacterium]MBK9570533.1 YceI family protein [Chitinophagaceae bacterium]MBL0273989.1 YceI family protein [Chitinophagaceae bacterium]
MKKTILALAFIISAGSLLAQKKTTTSAIVSFDASTEKDALPKAENKTVIGSLDTQTGDVAFEAAVKNFSFSSPKMQEHFNGDNWFKSDTYPVFSFTGKIEKISKVKFTKDGTYSVSADGVMKIRDVSNKAKIEGTITVAGGKIKIASNFVVKLADYNITGMPIESGKVDKQPKVTVTAEF